MNRIPIGGIKIIDLPVLESMKNRIIVRNVRLRYHGTNNTVNTDRKSSDEMNNIGDIHFADLQIIGRLVLQFRMKFFVLKLQL